MTQKINNNDTNKKEIYPWEAEHVRKDVQKAFTAHFPEEYILKLRYISAKTNKSQQKMVREIVCAEIDRLLQTLE